MKISIENVATISAAENGMYRIQMNNGRKVGDSFHFSTLPRVFNADTAEVGPYEVLDYLEQHGIDAPPELAELDAAIKNGKAGHASVLDEMDIQNETTSIYEQLTVDEFGVYIIASTSDMRRDASYFGVEAELEKLDGTIVHADFYYSSVSKQVAAEWLMEKYHIDQPKAFELLAEKTDEVLRNEADEGNQA